MVSPGNPDPPSDSRTLRRQRWMLVATAREPSLDDIAQAIQRILEGQTPEAVASELWDEGLAAIWLGEIMRLPASRRPPPDLIDALNHIRWTEAARYMAQTTALQEVDTILARAHIDYAVFKGAHIRERIWSPPSLRNANDIDILVRPDDRDAAIAALKAVGYLLQDQPAPSDHEATLTRGPVAIDLHWDILGPGRTRKPMTARLLANRRRRGAFWTVGDTDAVFLMLVHPAFTRYVTNLSLAGVAEFQRWVETVGVDWPAVEAQLQDQAVKTAAWTVLTWFQRLLAPDRFPVPDAVMARLAPGRLRQAYLTVWISNDLPVRLWSIPILTPLAFTLALHDTAGDIARAAAARLKATLSRRWLRGWEARPL